MSDVNATIRRLAHEVHRYLQVAHLTLSLPLLLLLAPVVGAMVLSSSGLPAAGVLLGVLIVTLCLWGVAWLFNDLMNALHKDESHSLILRGVVTNKQAVSLLIVLNLTAVVAAAVLGAYFCTLVPVAFLVAFTFPWLRQRTYLSDAWVGLGIAWTVPLAYAATGHWPDKGGALLGVVTLLWATGWSVLYQWPRHSTLMDRGMRSLGLMFGSSTGYLVISLQVSVLVGAWLAQEPEKLGSIYLGTLALSAGLIAWQSLLLQRSGVAAVDQALRLHTLSGVCLWFGITMQILTAA